MWVHDGEPVERIEQILEAYKRKTGRLYIDGATPGTQYEPLKDHETRAALAVEARCLHGAEQFAMFIPRTINTGPSDWTKPFGHDLCIQWDSSNPFTLREFQDSGGVWRYPLNPFPKSLNAILAKQEPFRSMFPAGVAFNLMNAFGGRLPMEVFMQLVYKCGWAIRIVQDHLNALKIREPPRSEARARDDWQDAVSLLNLIKAQIKAMFFSPEEWFTAIHFALDLSIPIFRTTPGWPECSVNTT
jgi:hypothetical protein